MRAPYVNIIVGPQSYHTLPELVAKLARSEKHLIDLDFIEEEKFDNLPKEYSAQGASAFVSIQEGLINFVLFVLYRILGAGNFLEVQKKYTERR